MIAKRLLLPILGAIIMAFAMMPMTAGKVFAENTTDAFYTPLVISYGFNSDGVLEDRYNGDVEGIDNPERDKGYAFYALEGTEGSLPLSGVIETSTGRSFLLGDYASNNVCVLNSSNGAAELTFDADSQDHYSSLAFLVTGGNNGGTANLRINMVKPENQNDTNSVTSEISVPDWNSTVSVDANPVYRCGRVKLDGGNELETGDCFSLYEVSVDLSDDEYAGYAVTSVELTVENLAKENATICIFAVSGVDTAKCTALFDGNGGTAATTMIRAAQGKAITLPVATRTGYELEGWYDNEETKVGEAGDSYTLNGNVTLRANWTKTAYVVSYNRNGGTGTMPAVAVMPVDPGEKNLTLPECAFTKAKRVFDGWSVDGTTYLPGEQIEVIEDTTVKAVWRHTKIKTYDRSQDGSTTRVAGKLVLTDPNTGMQFTKNLEGVTLDSKMHDPVTSEIEDLIDNMKTELQSEAAMQDGPVNLTTTVSDPVPKAMDGRTYTVYQREKDAEILEDYKCDTADSNGDLYDKIMVVAGEYGNEWLITVTMEGQYTSHPIILSDKTIKLSASSFTYNGKVQKPTFRTSDGNKLTERKDYTAKWSNSSSKNVGTYSVTITGIGNYRGTAKATYSIRKAANPLTIKPTTGTVKYSKVKKKAQSLAVNKVIIFTKKGQGTMNYIKTYGNKKITISKKTGTVTVQKGLKKGTYKVTVKVTAAGNKNYKASAVKKLTFKVKVY